MPLIRIINSVMRGKYVEYKVESIICAAAFGSALLPTYDKFVCILVLYMPDYYIMNVQALLALL